MASTNSTTRIIPTSYGPQSSSAANTTNFSAGSAKASDQSQGYPLPTSATSHLMKPLKKVTLYSSQLGTAVFSFPFNPEDISITIPTSMGQYQGVQHYPSLFYSGKRADQMTVKFFVTDREVGIVPTFIQIEQFALPLAISGNRTGFAAPPVSNLNYWGLGSFKGFVVSPKLTPAMLAPDLVPVQGYIEFEFHVLKWTPAVTTSYSGQGASNTGIRVS